MKKLLQFTELYVPGANSVLMMVTIGIVLLLLRMLIYKFWSSKKSWKNRKKAREIESNMWSIE